VKGLDGRRASIRDVATAAGVSIATVSNALNHPDRVALSTRERVQRAVDRLGFVPNAQARSLASGRTRTIGLLMTDLTNSYFVDIVRGAQEVAHAGGFSPLIGSAENDSSLERSLIASFTAERFAGVIHAPVHDGAPRARRHRADGPPTVLVNAEAPARLACSVASDDVLGGYLAARHLIERDHRRLLFVTTEAPLLPVDERRRGVERAVSEVHGVGLEVWTVPDLSVASGIAVAARLGALPQHVRPTGVAAPSDLLALGIVNGVHGLLAVPGELSVIGYDNDASARDARVPLTTVAQDGVEIGREAMRMLADEIAGRAEGRPHAHRSVRVAPRLVLRGSTSLAPFELD
jgi:LacI family transcriptional regulator